MNGYFAEFEKWNRKEPLLLRIDYGYPIPEKFAFSFDALFDPISDIKNFFEKQGEKSASIIRNAHYLFSPRRKDNLFQDLIKSVEGKPAVFETRFSKSFKTFCSIFSKEGIKFSKIDIPQDGSLPPLLSSIQSNRELLLKHILYEWESGLLMARGSSSLIDVAKIIAESEEPLTLTQISKKMGITLGAVASYLHWMEEASLVRKEKKRFSLRHKGFYLLFKESQPENIQSRQMAKKEDPMDLD